MPPLPKEATLTIHTPTTERLSLVTASARQDLAYARGSSTDAAKPTATPTMMSVMLLMSKRSREPRLEGMQGAPVLEAATCSSAQERAL